MSKNYDLAVAYRIYSGMSRTAPPIHAESKYKLAELCLRSFKASLGTLRVKLWAILDNCPPEYEALFISLWSKEDLVLIREPGVGNAETFARQIQVLSSQDEAEFVYLAEDDYVYLAGSFERAVDFLRTNDDVDFCSPYDHPDCYNLPFHQHKMRIKVHGGRAWKTANSTTCSLLTRKTTLIETRSVLLSYSRKNTDLGMWLSLTKHHVFNPLQLLIQPILFPYLGWSLACAWRFNWSQILFGRKYVLWVPVPSLATHMVANLLAPGIDWESEFEQQELRKSENVAE